MTDVLRVGVLGTGAMGASHARTLASWVPAARVTGVYDADTDRAGQVGAGVGAAALDSADALIGSSDVDAVVIASPDPLHAEQVLGCIDAGKPVLCEKPLASDVEGSRRVLDAEDTYAREHGRRLVQIGFMRRYDPAFVALRAHVAAGGIGTPRVVHCVHRNVLAHPAQTSDMNVTGSMVHELDSVPWLLDDPVAAITVRSPRDGSDGALLDPLVALLELASGVLCTVEVFVNARYGYDVRCEVVGDEGTVRLTPPYGLGVRAPSSTGGVSGVQVAGDFVGRFADAYRLELAAWTDGCLRGEVDGPGAGDGHRANLVAAAGVESLHTGACVAVEHFSLGTQ